MITSEQVNEIAAALAKAQAALKPAIKDSTNPAFKSKYADLASVIEAAQVYSAHGVAIVQDATLSEAGVGVTTRLLHLSGQWIECGPLTVPLAKRDAHGIGSAVTYGKRYALQAAGLIPSDDDDGNAAVDGKPEPVDHAYLDFVAGLDDVAAQGMDALVSAVKAESVSEVWRTRLRADVTTWTRLKKRAEKGAA